MAALFQIMLTASWLARSWWGHPGVLISGAVMGLTDVDALTFSMTRAVSDGVATSTAAAGLAIGIVANTALKLIVALTLGSVEFKRAAGLRLAGIGVAAALVIVALR